MKRLATAVVIAATLAAWVVPTFAQGASRPAPVEKKGPGRPRPESQRAEANDSNVARGRGRLQTPDTNESQEQLRQGARERIRQRAEERRSGLPPDGAQAERRKGRQGAADANAAGRRGGAPDRRQQLQALGEQAAHAEAKHLERTARLERIRELAEKEGDAKTLERVNALMKKEQQRYETKTSRIDARRDRAAQFERRRRDGNSPGRPGRAQTAAESE